ncbi:DsbA family protein [uncultured Croceicoccus sp.]|uniref:DsbA family protein n=1 Tax=uncultured Croceicoccus sp. TaxID=1295329 RepID=UPI00262F2F04|nr:DsbA family protein [uncultured Croceicoccus sp.]
MKAADRSRSHRIARRLVAAFAVILVIAFGAAVLYKTGPAEAQSDSASDMAADEFDEGERAAIEALVRNYILEHPEILPEAIERLRMKQAGEEISRIGDTLTEPFPGAVLGNPDGSRTLVTFTDYACGYCRQSVADVKALIAKDDDLRVVVRELPILSQASEDAARMALAAAKQGRYAAFHDAMYEGGRPDAQSIAAAAARAGLNMAKARADADGADIAREVETNRQIAAQLQVDGTPAWVAGDSLLRGAVGADALREALYRTAG